jgi:hypothetical protein
LLSLKEEAKDITNKVVRDKVVKAKEEVEEIVKTKDKVVADKVVKDKCKVDKVKEDKSKCKEDRDIVDQDICKNRKVLDTKEVMVQVKKININNGTFSLAKGKAANRTSAKLAISLKKGLPTLGGLSSFTYLGTRSLFLTQV